MVEAVFTASNKLLRVEFTFDVMSFMQQLRRASGRYDFQVVPNTLIIAAEESSEPRLVTEAVPPYRITSCNQSCCELLGYSEEQLVGMSFLQFNGPETEKDRLRTLIAHMKVRTTTTIATTTL